MSNSELCYYYVLGVRKQASASEIREAYRKLALGFCDFMQEMALMMESARSKTRYSLEDVQGLLMDTMADDRSIEFGFEWDNSQKARKKSCVR